MTSEALEIRPVVDADLPDVLALCTLSLGWPPDPRNEQLFRWKHLANPFGRSAMWAAYSNGKMVGFRSMLRWRFRHPDGTEISAVRAVDTATHPDFRGRGIFSRLTLHAVEQLRAEGVPFVFNTPNAMSRPGYLKLGWQDAGNVKIVVRPRGLSGMVAMVSARAPAHKWSEPLAIGTDQLDADEVAKRQTPNSRLVTAVTPEFLRWRYCGGPVTYRFVTFGPSGFVARARRRGGALELTLSYAWGDPGELAARLPALLDESRCSFAVATASTAGAESMLPAPTMGPALTLRPLARQPPASERFGFGMGDVALF